MSVVGGGDIPRPTSPHADVILGTLWPLQSESAWQTFAAAIKSEATRLFGEDGAQQDILRLVAVDQAGAFIEAATNLVRVSIATLETRYQTYNDASSVAQGVATRIWAIKLRMAESVATAETAITNAKNELEPQIQAATASLDGLRASQLTADLQGRITAAITQAQIEVAAEAATGAAEIAALNTKIGGASSDAAGGATPLDWDGGGAGIPAAPAMPVPTTPGGNGVQAVNYDTFKEGTEPLSDRMPGTRQAEEPTLSQAAQDSNRFPDEVRARDATSAPHGDAGKSAMPPAASAPSTGGAGSPASSGGSPASVLGSAMRPMSSAPSSSASPASSGAPASGSPSSAVSGTGAQTGSGGAGAAGTGSGAASGVSRAVGGASAGAGIAETSARMGTGAVSAAANTMGTAGNVGAQIAQSATSAAAPPPAAGPPPAPAGTPAPAAGPAPMAMLPPTTAPVAGGLPPAAGPAAPGPGIPGTPQQQGPGSAPTNFGGTTAGGPGANTTPVMVPMSQVRTVGLDGATGDVLIGQAADAARSILETVIAQTRHAGYGSSQGFVWAVTVMAERTGGITAWLATSEGPSYIPRGVRVPDDVRLAVTDPVVGRQLWDAAAAAGGADPLEVLARHAELRDSAGPGGRVLALAATVPMARVMDWAATVGARPVSVDPRTIDAAAAVGDQGQHRCAAAMPWEWQQANAFSEKQRLQVAVRHMMMAATAAHLTDAACERVTDAFDRGNPVTASDWADVRQAFAMACVNYEMTRAGAPLSGASTTLERAFRTARAAEVVWCARDYASVTGCADLLYATRLAGAPLNSAAAVA